MEVVLSVTSPSGQPPCPSAAWPSVPGLDFCDPHGHPGSRSSLGFGSKPTDNKGVPLLWLAFCACIPLGMWQGIPAGWGQGLGVWNPIP